MSVLNLRFWNLEIWSWLALGAVAALFAAAMTEYLYEKIIVMGSVFYLCAYAAYSYTAYSTQFPDGDIETYKKLKKKETELKAKIKRGEKR